MAKKNAATKSKAAAKSTKKQIKAPAKSALKNQGHEFRCLPKTVAQMFIYINGVPEKRGLVDDRGFGGLSYLPNEYLNQRLLKQIYDRYDVHDNTIYSDAAAVKITTDKIGHALGLSSRGTPYDTKVARNELSEEDKEVHDYFKGFTTVGLQDLIKATPVDTEENKKLWMRAFILFVQKVFLLPNSTGLLKMGQLKAEKEQLKKKSTKRIPLSDSKSQTKPEPPYSNSTDGEGGSMSDSDKTISEQPPQQKEIRSKRRFDHAVVGSNAP
ncbi:hypothetical protein PIB30_078430 [Stylosanthes scabra]|uniref:Uncharacterized protein n=1 Tax=Stylosanthes scabra TaxID=79078 RepID=A0ABU6TR90_9FABA|nr:hypothetical protein [Stylosanthes scabra]